MAKRKPTLQSAKNICLPSAQAEKQVQVQMTSVKKAVHRSIVLTMVSSIAFLLSVSIVMGVMNPAGIFALIGTGALLIASVAAAFEAKTLFHTIAEEHRVDHLKTEFISLASHQLRTPLSSLKWYAEIFSEEKGLTKEQKGHAK
jgi:signal transduction histidine kinase